LHTLRHLCESHPTHCHHSYQAFSTTDHHLVSETSEVAGMAFPEFKGRIDRGDTIYLTDLDIVHVPQLAEDFNSAMRPSNDMMPGGAHCLMKHVSKFSMPSANLICHRLTNSRSTTSYQLNTDVSTALICL
jgi:hypothetical protein